MVEQARTGFIAISLEHLNFLPPIGRWYDGELIDADDGETDVCLIGGPLRQFIATGGDPNPLAEVDGLPGNEPLPNIDAAVSVEHSNFGRRELLEVRDSAPLPVETEERWAELPPLIWTSVIPVTWGAVKFAEAFLETLGKATGEALVAWMKDAWGRSKEPERDRLLTLDLTCRTEPSSMASSLRRMTTTKPSRTYELL